MVPSEFVAGQVLGPDRRSVKAQQAPALENAINDRLGEVVVVQRVAPSLRMLVGGEQHGAPLDVTVVDEVVEDVRRIGAVREVANLVDDQ